MTKKTILLMVLFLNTLLLLAQKKSFPIGGIFQEKVVADTTQSYQVYIPKSAKEQPLAVLIIFDPSGFSTNAVRLFQEAAEECQALVFCSDQSKNGPYDRNLAIFENMYADMQTKFDFKNLPKILTGFSGGSRLATLLAVTKPDIDGVIACGAGYPPIKKNQPTKATNFGYFGIVGRKDMNYSEMLNVEKNLQMLEVDHHFLYTNAGHTWPGADLHQKALIWQMARLETQNQLTTTTFTNKCLQNVQNQLDTLFENGNIIDYRNTKLAVEKVFPTSKMILKTKEIKEQDWQEAVEKRGNLVNNDLKIKKKYYDEFQLSKYKARNYKSDDWWLSEYKKWSKLTNNSSSEVAFQAARIQYSLYALFVEQTQNAIGWEEYNGAAWSANLLAKMVDNKLYPFYLSAKIAALQQQYKVAEKKLALAVKHGLSKKQSILRDPAFAPMKGRKGFEKILEGLE